MALFYFRYMNQKRLGISIIFIVLLVCFCKKASAEKVYEFNSTCQQAYQEIIKLKLRKLINLLNQNKPLTNPLQAIIIKEKLLEYFFKIEKVVLSNYL